MPYKTIQQNFSNGELNPRMQGRSDTEMYYKSAQKLRQVVTTPFGGLTRKPGSKVLSKIVDTSSLLEWTPSTTLADAGDTIDNLCDKDYSSYFKSSGTIGAKRNGLVRLSETLSVINKVSLIKASLYTQQASAIASISTQNIPITDFTYNYPNAGNMCVGVESKIQDILYANIIVGYTKPGSPNIEKNVFVFATSSNPYPNSIYFEDKDYDASYTPFYIVDPHGQSTILANIIDGGVGYKTAPQITIAGDGTGAQGVAVISGGKVVGIKVNGAVGYSFADIEIAAPQNDYSDIFQLKGVTEFGRLEDIGNSFEIRTGKETTFSFDICKKYQSISLERVGSDVLLAGLKAAELQVYKDDPRSVKLLPFIFSNEQAYNLALTNGEIQIYSEDTLQETIEDSLIDSNFIKKVKYAQSADTAIFSEENTRTKRLFRATPNKVYSTLVDCDVDPHDLNIIRPAKNKTSAIRLSSPFKPSTSDFEIILKVKTEENSVLLEPSLYIYSPASGPYYPGLILGKQSYNTDLNTGKLYLLVGVKGKMQEQMFGSYIAPGMAKYLKVTYIEGVGYKAYISDDGVTWELDITLNEPAEFWQYDQSNLEFRNPGGEIYLNSIKVSVAGNIWFPNGNTIWNFENYPLETIPMHCFLKEEKIAPAFTVTPDAEEGIIKFTGYTPVNNVIGQYLEGNGGRLKITSYGNNFVQGYTVIPFYTKDAIAGGGWTLTTNYEPVWSDARGWPATVTFHEGRLYFGGSKTRPQTTWGSKVGIFNKFNKTSGYDDDAVEFTLDNADLNKIVNIHSQRNLQIFTTGGEFVCLTSYNESITPNNVNASKQTSIGSYGQTTPIEIEGSIIFLERHGKGLFRFLYTSDQEAYSTANDSLINSHLIHEPIDLDVEKNSLVQQTNYVYIVNSDGTMTVINLLLSQNITGGFSLWETSGKIKSVSVLPDATYIAVERSEIDGNKIYLEKLDYSLLTDGAEVVENTNKTFLQIKRFANKKVDIAVNDIFFGCGFVSADGILDLGARHQGRVEVGLPIRAEVESNILEIPQLGTGLGKKKRLAQMTVRTLDTKKLSINRKDKELKGVGIEDTTFYGVGDWNVRPTWTFKQKEPYKFNILAIEMNVNYEVESDEY